MKLVTAAIIQNEDKYFIARRGPSEKLSGYWEFPGGKVEEGESLSDCLRRWHSPNFVDTLNNAI